MFALILKLLHDFLKEKKPENSPDDLENFISVSRRGKGIEKIYIIQHSSS